MDLRRFLIVTFAWSWGWWAPAAFGVVAWPGSAALHVLGTLGPAIGAFAAARCAPGGSARLRRRLRWDNLPWPWLLAAIAVPAALLAIGMAIAALQGTPLPAAWSQRHAEFPWLNLPVYAAMSILCFGFGEEIGWRGWLLPRLQSRASAARASVAVALIWIVWHAPLFAFLDSMRAMGPALTAGWLLNIAVATAMMTWLFNAARGNVLPVAILHGLVDVAFLAAGSQQVMTTVGIGLTLLGLASLFHRGRDGALLQPWGRRACEHGTDRDEDTGDERDRRCA
jgi:membrane protease YdiL (CAAX protease family)